MSQTGSTMDDRAVPTGGPRPGAALWLKRGWADLWNQPVPSLLYGVIIFTISWGMAGGLIVFDLSAYLFPALAGF
jgi:hypothetical protein